MQHACRWGLSTCVASFIDLSHEKHPPKEYNHNRVNNCSHQVDGKKVRLFGLDAPESKQSCRAADGSQYLCGTATKLSCAVDISAMSCEHDHHRTPVAPWLASTSRGIKRRHTRHALQVRRSPSCCRPRSGSRVCGVRPRPPTSTAARHARVPCASSIQVVVSDVCFS